MSINPVAGAGAVPPHPAAIRGESGEAPGVKDGDGDAEDRGTAPAPAAIPAPGRLNVTA